MKYGLRIESRALKDLRRLDKRLSKRIVDRIEIMAEDLTGDVKKLTDHSPQYRLRIGDYRVLFDTRTKQL
ncbi:MAG: type II toxin-antitoxin system RelE family toxin [Pyrinomonadaceae bacterium]